MNICNCLTESNQERCWKVLSWLILTSINVSLLFFLYFFLPDTLFLDISVDIKVYFLFPSRLSFSHLIDAL